MTTTRAKKGSSPLKLTTLALAVALTGCGTTGGSPSATQTPTPREARIQLAAETCGVAGVADAGASIIMETAGKKRGGTLTLPLVFCVLAGLKAPTYVTEHIKSTRSIDGQQTDAWDGIDARWTYHPDDGLRITLVDRRLT